MYVINPDAVRRMSEVAFEQFLVTLLNTEPAQRAATVKDLVLSGRIPVPQARALRTLLR